MSKKPSTFGVSAETTAALGGDAISTETAKARPQVKMSPEKTKTNITYFVSLATHKRLKQHALDSNTSLQQILDEALDTYFSVRGLPPIERATGGR